jgi:hypothetical protein
MRATWKFEVDANRITLGPGAATGANIEPRRDRGASSCMSWATQDQFIWRQSIRPDDHRNKRRAMFRFRREHHEAHPPIPARELLVRRNERSIPNRTLLRVGIDTKLETPLLVPSVDKVSDPRVTLRQRRVER